MLIAIEMQTAIACPACDIRTPLPGLRSKAACRGCATEIDVLAVHKQWHNGGTHYAFGSYYDALAEAVVRGPGHELHDARDGQKAPVQLKSVELACPACKEALAPPAERAPHVACVCGESVVVRWADHGTKDWDRRIWCVLGDAFDPKGATEREGGARVTGNIVSCGRCGAPLPGSGTRRSVVCDHCNAANYLFDAAWLKINPDAGRHAFTLVYQVDDAQLAKIIAAAKPATVKSLDDAGRARLAALTSQATASRLERALHGDGAIDLATARELMQRELSADEAKHVDKWLSDVERESLAKHHVAPALVELWAAATDGSTRAIAARLTSVDRWLADPAAEVRVAVARRDQLPPEAIDRLAHDTESAVRAAIAARSDVPIELLKHLRKDADPAVAEAARSNPLYHPGLLGRLFGD